MPEHAFFITAWGDASLTLNRLNETKKHYENALQARLDFKEAGNRLAEFRSARERRSPAADFLHSPLVLNN